MIQLYGEGHLQMPCAEELLLDDPVQLSIGVLSAEHPEINATIIRGTYAKLDAGILDRSISVVDTKNNSFDVEGGK